MADFALRRLQLKLTLALPAPILRALAGGTAVHVGGRTLDPRLQFIAAQAARAPSAADVAGARAAANALVALLGGSPEPGVRIETLSVPGGEGDIAARAYRPEDQDPAAPVMLFAHFGGGVVGDLDTCHGFCTLLAKVARWPVLSIDYRLAPEHRFPAALEDVLAAYRWTAANAGRFGADKVAIGGDSMGGNFAAVVCQALQRAGEAQPAMQLLIYPALDVAGEGGSMGAYGESWPLSAATMAWFMGQYMGPGDTPEDLRLSPLRASELKGLAPAVIATAGFDPLLDQGEAYAKALAAAGVAVQYRRYDHLAHAFTAMTGAVAAADAACREIAALTRQAVTGA